jgi:hypothetical protein
MNQTSPEIAALLSQLRDITPPPPINWWPPAIGWWLVLGVAVALAALTFYLTKKFKQRQRWNQAISSELALIAESRDAATVVNNANRLLKRLMRLKFPDLQTNNLHGKQWVQLLELKYGDAPEAINLTPLADAGYQCTPDLDVTTLLHDLRIWIKRCC